MTDSDSESDVFIPEEPAENPFVRWLLHPWIIVIIAAVVGVYVAGSHLWTLLPDLSHRPEYRLKAEEIRFTEPPKWVSKTFLRQVIHEGGLAEEFSLLDDRLVEKVAAAFQKNPWVAKVVSVRKDLARRLFVTLEYRKPVAVVEVGADRYPIDCAAVILPPPEMSQNGDELPVIVNVHTVPPTNVGSPWVDRLVEGAARLAAVLGPTWKKLKLASIEVPEEVGAARQLSESVYKLVTADRSRIIWGLPPGTDHPGELTPEQKIGRLEEYNARNGGFSDEDGPYEIDIRHWHEMTRQPLIARPSGAARF